VQHLPSEKVPHRQRVRCPASRRLLAVTSLRHSGIDVACRAPRAAAARSRSDGQHPEGLLGFLNQIDYSMIGYRGKRLPDLYAVYTKSEGGKKNAARQLS
jgi:hypothetical protein